MCSHTITGSVKELNTSLHYEQCVCECVFWEFTFAVGIWTAIDGVGSSPGAEGCMAGGCIGLKAPCENSDYNTSSSTYS